MKGKVLLTALLSFSISLVQAGDKYANDDDPIEERDRSEQLDPKYRDVRVALGGGYARRLGKRLKEHDSKLEQMSKDMMNGFNIDFDAQYYFKEDWGLGLNANFVQSSAEAENVTLPDAGKVSFYNETNKFFFIGPSFAYRTDFGKFLLTGSVALGPLFYENTSSAYLKGSKTTFGSNFGIAIEYKLAQSLGAGLKLSYTAGTINSLNYGGRRVQLDEKMSVSNFMLTGFLSFRTWR